MLDQYRSEVVKSERSRNEAYGGLQEQIRSLLRALVRLTLVGSLFVTLQGIVFADTILYWGLGPQFVGGAPVLQRGAILPPEAYLELVLSAREAR